MLRNLDIAKEERKKVERWALQINWLNPQRRDTQDVSTSDDVIMRMKMCSDGLVTMSDEIVKKLYEVQVSD